MFSKNLGFFSSYHQKQYYDNFIYITLTKYRELHKHALDVPILIQLITAIENQISQIVQHQQKIIVFTWSNKCLMARSILEPCIEILSEFKLWMDPDILRFKLVDEPDLAWALKPTPTPVNIIKYNYLYTLYIYMYISFEYT